MPIQKQKIIKTQITVFLLLITGIFFAGEADAAGKSSQTKQYQSSNYTITYPASGFDEQLPKFVSNVDKIIPFVESLLGILSPRLAA